MTIPVIRIRKGKRGSSGVVKRSPGYFGKSPSLLQQPCGHETLSWVEEQQLLPVLSSAGPVQTKKALHVWSIYLRP